jgi:hypothetical protein
MNSIREKITGKKGWLLNNENQIIGWVDKINTKDFLNSSVEIKIDSKFIDTAFAHREGLEGCKLVFPLQVSLTNDTIYLDDSKGKFEDIKGTGTVKFRIPENFESNKHLTVIKN